jgi:peptide/nickel transport system ATP-binding protein
VRPALEAAGLVITSSTGRRLVDGLDLAVAAGDAVAIVGESGSGKSMTARALTGLLPRGCTATGSIRIGDLEFIGADEQQWRGVRGATVTWLPQDPFTMLSPLRRVRDTIAEGTGGDVDVIARLREVGVDDPSVADRFSYQLSGGLRQRVGMAAALASDPQILIADEPSTALDVTTQRRVLQLLGELRIRRNLALILITHDLRVAFSVSDRVYVMYGGAVVERGSSRLVDKLPLHPYTHGLLMSEPVVETRILDLQGIPGRVTTVNDVVGCTFSTRCGHVQERCREDRPELRSAGPERATACVRSEELRDVLASRARVSDMSPARPQTAPVLCVSGVSKTFAGSRGSTSVRALDDVSIEIRAGEIAAVVGESGSGKTTLARIVAGLEVADSGSVEIPGRSRWAGKGPSPVQMVFQDPASTLNPARRVRDILAAALRAGGKTADTAAVEGLLSEVSLPAEYGERKPSALSGGERQRVAVARAIAPQPQLLLCDEPVSALDVSVQAQILALFRELGERHAISMLFITHDLGVVRQMADRVYVLQQGRLVESGSVDDVLARPRDTYTRALIGAVPQSDPGWLVDAEATAKP